MTQPRSFDPAAFESAFDAAAANCRELSRSDAEQFVERGYVVVKGAFSKDIAAAVCAAAWRELGEKHGVDRHDPDTWNQPFMGRKAVTGYVRTQGTGRRFLLKSCAPRAFYAQADIIGGADRLPGNGAALAWGDAAIGNLGLPNTASWQPPHPRQPGWHKDGWHFRHFLDSPEQGLLTVPIFSDILPRSGGTFIASDSIAPVARLLESLPAGLHPDSVQGGGYLIPGLVEQCTRFEELTGEAGDVALLHPYMLHRVSVNPSIRPRFIANAALVLAQPMRFAREPGDAYSLVELTTLRALQRNALDYRATRPAQAFKPFPFRIEEEADKQRRRLNEEKAELAAQGLITPAWAAEMGYDSNRTYLRTAS